MKYGWTTFPVKDLQETIKFYEELLGAKVEKRFPAGPGREIVFINAGGNSLEFVCDEGATPEPIRGVSIGFEVDDAESEKKVAESKGFTTTPMISPNDNIKFFFVGDPNGIQIQLAQSM